jgi:hypothetical protein
MEPTYRDDFAWFTIRRAWFHGLLEGALVVQTFYWALAGRIDVFFWINIVILPVLVVGDIYRIRAKTSMEKANK